MRGRSGPALAGSAPSRVHDRRKLRLPGKAGACLSSPGRLIRGRSPRTAPAVVFGYIKEVVWWVVALGSSGRTPNHQPSAQAPLWSVSHSPYTGRPHTRAATRPPAPPRHLSCSCGALGKRTGLGAFVKLARAAWIRSEPFWDHTAHWTRIALLPGSHGFYECAKAPWRSTFVGIRGGRAQSCPGMFQFRGLINTL